MDSPWRAEYELDRGQALALIEEQFPELEARDLKALGEGWDNTAYVLDGRVVFRFPRRRLGAQLLERECRVLPELAGHLPLAVPTPQWIGRPDRGYPFPFAGYPFLEGTTGCRAALDRSQRSAGAPALAHFLRSLHDVPTARAQAMGVGPDELRRVDVPYRKAGLQRRLEEACSQGWIEPAPWGAILEDAPDHFHPRADTLTHGDLYVRHVLFDGAGLPRGVIDWGDVHLGDAAVDLALAHSFLPPEAHPAFLEIYGPVDGDTWRVARLRALFTTVALLHYGHASGDESLLTEVEVALGFLAS